MTQELPLDPEELSFGEALAELEAIVEALDRGQLDLEESLARYERGVALLRACRSRLNDAQQKVTMLVGELEMATDAEDEAAEEPEE